MVLLPFLIIESMASKIVDLTGTHSPGQPTSLTTRASPRWDDSAFGTSKMRKRKAALLDDVEARLFTNPEDFRRCWASFMADLPSADVRELLLDILQKSPSARDIAIKEYSRLKAKKQRIEEEKKWKNCKRCHQPYNTSETDTQWEEPYHPGQFLYYSSSSIPLN